MTTDQTWDKSKLVSRYVTEGPDAAPRRAMLRAMKLTDTEIAQPLVGVATCWNELHLVTSSSLRRRNSSKKA